MSQHKVFAGVKLRELRQSLGLSQKQFANALGISLPYMNQMERNHRPISSKAVLRLAEEFDYDIKELAQGSEERITSDLSEALNDDVFKTRPPLGDLSLIATNAPGFARAFLELYHSWRRTNERIAVVDEALGEAGSELGKSPWEDVRDFFHYRDNYIDEIDRAAEAFSSRAGRRQSARMAALSRLGNLGITVHHVDSDRIRRLDRRNSRLEISRRIPPETQDFQMLVSVAELTQADLIDEIVSKSDLQSDTARRIASIGLANYFAGASLLPYQQFVETAESERHDLERLAMMFDASIEQVAHRLSTLQRSGARGIPFFFVRVDQAGTITKRHSATKLQFARFGGACPLWNVHRAFEAPGQILRQLAQTPDGAKYICLARDVSKPSGSFGTAARRYAIGLGCEVEYAPHLVYADTLDVGQNQGFEQIGISCRICPRQHCHQRSVPPFGRDLSFEQGARDILPYHVR